jgi:hypothetical protein
MSLWGKTDTSGAKPKYLSDTLRNDQSATDKASTFGVSVSEAEQPANREKGLKTPGWSKTVSYTDAQGNLRNKTEILVAFGGDFTGADAADDAVVLDNTITIGTQPAAHSVVAGATATFSVVATIAPTGSMTYQWQKQESGSSTWSNISGATSASYTTGALTVADDNGDKYRVVISGSAAKSVTSRSATLTVTAS